MNEIRELLREHYLVWAKENNTSFDKLKWYKVAQLKEMYGLEVLTTPLLERLVSPKVIETTFQAKRTIKILLTFFQYPLCREKRRD
jgi:hypothetical protein